MIDPPGASRRRMTTRRRMTARVSNPTATLHVVASLDQEGPMRRTFLLIALAGCVHGPTYSEELTPRQPTIFTDPSTGTILGDHPRAVGTAIDSPPAAAWLAVKKV